MIVLVIALSSLLAAMQVPAQGTHGAMAASAQSTTVPSSSPASGPPSFADLSDEQLVERAKAARSRQRQFAPAGDNAIEYDLALRDRHPDDAAVKRDLQDLFTYASIGASKAAQSNSKASHAEALRILGLLERIDPDAPSLPRLRDTIEGQGGR